MANSPFSGFVSKISFRSGLNIDLSDDSIVIVIGPNNSGKSATLADISSFAREGRVGVVLSHVSIQRKSATYEVMNALRPLRSASGIISAPGISFHEANFPSIWESESALGPFFFERMVADLTTRSRLSDCDPPPAFESREPFRAKHPFQYFFRDDKLELRASELFRRAFRKDLVVHRGGSMNIPAYVGSRPDLKEGENLVSGTYLDRIEMLDKLENQGDGVRSFVSILGHVLVESKPIILIDEPEAFLHPPQARLIANIIGVETHGRQVFIATHSGEILQGILGLNVNRTSVIRVSRNNSGSGAVLLDSENISALWQDPILQFSNILDGLFHEAVVITEADADCRFYESLMSAANTSDTLPDIHFTYSGGKDRLPTVINALRALGVVVATITDFDLLNSERTLERIISAHGGDWSVLKPDWQLLKGYIEQNTNFVGAKRFKAEMTNILRDINDDGAVDKQYLKKIRELSRNASAWDHAKRSGVSSLENGIPSQVAEKILNYLENIGIFVNPQGELEGFCRSIGAHGPRWVEEVMKKDLALDKDLRAAREFGEKIARYVHDKAYYG